MTAAAVSAVSQLDSMIVHVKAVLTRGQPAQVAVYQRTRSRKVRQRHQTVSFRAVGVGNALSHDGDRDNWGRRTTREISHPRTARANKNVYVHLFGLNGKKKMGMDRLNDSMDKPKMMHSSAKSIFALVQHLTKFNIH